MEQNIQPSFIPKKPLTQAAAKQKQHVSLFSLITTIIFITTLILCGVVYGMEYFLNKNIETKKVELKTEIAKFEPALVNELSRLDARLNSAQELIDNHLSVQTLFNVIEANTLKGIRFTNFSFAYDPTGRPIITMGGEAQSFIAIALQEDQFDPIRHPENAKYIKNVVINNPNLDKDGKITFVFTAFVDPISLSYPMIKKEQGVSLSSTPTSAGTSTATTSTQRATSTSSTR
jgi:hypothetical protein